MAVGFLSVMENTPGGGKGSGGSANLIPSYKKLPVATMERHSWQPG
jgi:hypothetical protein